MVTLEANVVVWVSAKVFGAIIPVPNPANSRNHMIRPRALAQLECYHSGTLCPGTFGPEKSSRLTDEYQIDWSDSQAPKNPTFNANKYTQKYKK